jgi:hypothetical protein
MATETIVRKTCDRCDHHGRPKREARHTIQFGVFGRQVKMDLCDEDHEEHQAVFGPWFDSAQHLGKLADMAIPAELDPFPSVGIFTDRGYQVPDPRVDVVWWNTPVGANTATRDEFRAARRVMWKWAEAEVVKGKPRFPNLSTTRTGALPRPVGFAWTREVWAPMQELAKEEEPEPALIPAIPAPPKARPKTRRKVA